MDEAEREKRLREMMSNADWRETQRTKNVKHYREMDAKQVRIFSQLEMQKNMWARLRESRACQGVSHAIYPTYFPAYLNMYASRLHETSLFLSIFLLVGWIEELRLVSLCHIVHECYVMLSIAGE